VESSEPNQLNKIKNQVLIRKKVDLKLKKLVELEIRVDKLIVQSLRPTLT